MDDAGTRATNRATVAAALDSWASGTGSITGLLADGIRWTIVGNSAASKTYESKQQFIDEVLDPFGRRFRAPFRPVAIRGLYADGDTVIVVWDGEGIARRQAVREHLRLVSNVSRRSCRRGDGVLRQRRVQRSVEPGRAG